MPSAGGVGGVWAPGRRRLTVGLVLAVTLVAFEALAITTVMPVVGRQLGDVSLYGGGGDRAGAVGPQLWPLDLVE